MPYHDDNHCLTEFGGRRIRNGQPPGWNTSRRQFLTSFAAFGACAVLPAWQTPAASPKPRLIDVHHHVFPPAFLAAGLETYIPLNRAVVSAWTPQKALAEMDSNGVATAIASLTSPGVWLGDVQAARSLARKSNEYSAQLVRDYPGRFGFFAAVPLPDTEGSLREIAYALDELKADGIGLMTNYDDKWPGDAAFAPVFEELNRRKAVVFFHPTAASCCKDLVPNVPRAWAELPHDTTRAVLSLLVSGTFARLRNIRFIFSHAGGTIPMLAGRIVKAGNFAENLAENAPHGIEYELKRLYYDIAISANRPAMAALMNLIPTSQILFGGDYPFMPIGATATGMTTLGLSTADLGAIARENALALLPRLKA